MLAGIAYKIASTFVFACMMAIVKGLSHYPVGELVAFRSFFALIVLVIWLAQRGEFPQALRTRRVGGHLLRSLAGTGSMALNFGAFAFLPLADVTVVGYASPLIIVVLAAIWLGERVGPGRWFGVALGFCGVLVMLWEHVGTGDQGFSRGAIGAAMSLTAAFCVAVAMIQTSRLVQSEHMGAVVFYFQFTAGCVGLSLMLLGALWPASWPFAGAMASLAWVTPLEPSHWALLIAAGLFGGIGQILMTRGYTLADASILACFDYVSMIWVLALGAVFLGEFPSFSVLAGAAIITIAGLLVIWSEKTKKFV
jgi:hypothetical protein